MEITPENDPLEEYGYDPTMNVEEVMGLLDVSDSTARKFLKANELYLKVSGTVRVPRLKLARVLFSGDVDSPEDEDSIGYFKNV